MMELDLIQIAFLKKQHRTEKDGDRRDRIKSVVLRHEGWSEERISKALLVHIDTVKRHLSDYDTSRKLESDAGGSTSKLSESQTLEIIEHLEEKTYTKAEDICNYIADKYGIKYTVSGITSWLKAHKFSYKEPKTTPLKADPLEQAAFIESYRKLKLTSSENEPILFIDSVHPTMATKVSYGWIRTGKDKAIGTIASRTRINLAGALDLESMKVHHASYDTINGANIIDFLAGVKSSYQGANAIHIVLDQAGYHKSKEVRAFALENGIKLHYLPSYSPNLNPIERLWKVMNETARNNVVFKSAKEFRERILKFFDVDYPAIAQSLVDRLTDNFRIVEKANSF